MAAPPTTGDEGHGPDWLARQAARSLAHLRSLDPTLLSPVTRRLLADAEARYPAAYPPLRLVPAPETGR